MVLLGIAIFVAAVIFALAMMIKTWPVEPEDEFDNWCIDIGHALYPNLNRDALFAVYVEQLIDRETNEK